MCIEDKKGGNRLTGYMKCPQEIRNRHYGHRSGYVIFEHPYKLLSLICKIYGHKWKVYDQYETGYIDYFKDQCQRCWEMRGIDY